jgi:ABC-2 type transport system permease protein
MTTPLTSWRALFVREYLEHRMAFQWAPIGIVVLLALSGLSAIGLNRVKGLEEIPFISALKIYELGYLVLLALWLVYLGIALFFYFGDAFSADRRNNAMLFWKSMPVTDAKILSSKALSGLVMFPVIILLVGMVTGLLFFLMVSVGAYFMSGLGFLGPLDGLFGFLQVTLFGIVFFLIAMAWYAPFFAWVGGLSTMFGRWSLPLAFVIPGLLVVIENVSSFGQGPRGGYIWNYIVFRWNNDALNEADFELMLMNSQPFDAGFYINRMIQGTDWTQMGIGLAFAVVVIWLASEYRRRRIA